MSNITRPLTVIRRRPNLVDLIIPKDPAVQGYRLRAALNFDAAFTDMLTADISSGYLDANVDRRKLHAINNRDHVRIVFDPQTFNGSHSLEDAQPFWLTFQPVDFSGAPGTESPAMLLLPEESLRGDSRVAIAGDAPAAGDISGSDTLYLPFRGQDLLITNNNSADELLVAFQPGGAEVEIAAGETRNFKDGAIGCLVVRGDAATVNFSASFTSFLPL